MERPGGRGNDAPIPAPWRSGIVGADGSCSAAIPRYASPRNLTSPAPTSTSARPLAADEVLAGVVSRLAAGRLTHAGLRVDRYFLHRQLGFRQQPASWLQPPSQRVFASTELAPVRALGCKLRDDRPDFRIPHGHNSAWRRLSFYAGSWDL